MLREWCVNNTTVATCAAPFLSSTLLYACIMGGWVRGIFRLPELPLYLHPHWTVLRLQNAELHLHAGLLCMKLFILASLSHWQWRVLGEVGLGTLPWLMRHSWWMSWKQCVGFPVQKVNMETWMKTILSPNDNYSSAFLQSISTQILQWAVAFNFTAWKHSDSVI